MAHHTAHDPAPMNIDQIAQEAADEICRAYGFNLTSIQRATALAIIKSAIEKAIKLQMDKDDEMWSAKLEHES